MRKKRIVIAGVLLAFLLGATACGQEEPSSENPQAVVTNEAGQPVADGGAKEAVTDLDGNTLHLEEGEYNVIETDEGSILQTVDYSLSMPKGWTAQEDSGRFSREDNEDATVQVEKLGPTEGSNALDMISSNQRVVVEGLLEYFGDRAADATVNYAQETLTDQQLDCRTVEVKVPVADGSIDFYAMYIYYVYKGELYKYDYVCAHGSYDPSVDPRQLLADSLSMK